MNKNIFNYFSNEPLLTTYWGGYFKNNKTDPQTLDMTPAYVDIVILAFVGPIEDSTVETNFLCSQYSASQIKEWIKTCHKNNIKVFVSVLDTPQNHWNTIDLVKFSKSLKDLIDDWELDGVDIDAESGMPSEVYVDTFINLATCIKNEIKTLPLTYTCYTGTNGPDGQILPKIKSKLDWIQLMAYFDSYEGMVYLYNDYNKIIDNIVVGVKAGSDSSSTSLDEVEKLALWCRNKKGIMLWTINRDTPQYTNCPTLTWAITIQHHLRMSEFDLIYNYIIKSLCC